MEFQAKAFQCMNAFQAPYKAVLISLYESAVKNGNTAIAEEVKENFDVQVEDVESSISSITHFGIRIKSYTLRIPSDG